MKYIGNQKEYAEHAGISKQAVNRAVKDGKIPIQPDGRINFAAADLARDQYINPARIKTPATGLHGPSSGRGGYSEARANREKYEAELSRLKVERELGKVLDRQQVEDAMVVSGRAIRQGLDGIVTWTDELNAAAQSGGPSAVRALLKGRVRDMENMIADKLNVFVVNSEIHE